MFFISDFRNKLVEASSVYTKPHTDENGKVEYVQILAVPKGATNSQVMGQVATEELGKKVMVALALLIKGDEVTTKDENGNQTVVNVVVPNLIDVGGVIAIVTAEDHQKKEEAKKEEPKKETK